MTEFLTFSRINNLFQWIDFVEFILIVSSVWAHKKCVKCDLYKSLV
ncbi:hypothetical protein HMPREF1567_3842 [Providencia alcalifaciens PAL-2]|uniref:Uncharacterized protein n=1 Tax=Providencia alcalifaciens 205/92 TaxID=1256988 RepID=A0AAV3M7W7_9GAMM|nr:hypothetical protein HMPREF1562_0653 [Providencia alcalifaciens F90-2004]EUC95586.1 hypothetical protein HMPREF1567_3842 [Providencia alcalifaciens PAL-2]EUD11504.1 hypothetical protein HMPREF1563_0817 [Providencia alcalifaciens 205/92]